MDALNKTIEEINITLVQLLRKKNPTNMEIIVHNIEKVLVG